MSNKNIRIRTTPGGDDKFIKVKLEQDTDELEVLSLRISQGDAYKRVCADYGVIVGRVIANGGVGVPNAKISLFIPLSDEDADNDVISSIYPFTSVTEDIGIDGKRYNLLPDFNSGENDCYTPIGSFPSKRKLLDNNVLLEVYEKYYKYTTTTNESGDYMLFGVPVGNHTLHMDVDMSDIGILSQKPYDLIREGASDKVFETTTKFKGGDDLDILAQVKTFNTGINVISFWGDTDECEVGINRHDFVIPTQIRTHAFFLGSLFSDNGKHSISKNCRIKKKAGNLCDTVTGEGTIEMIRKNANGINETYNINGGRVIDEDGTWAYQIPMNLDYKITNEFGELIPALEPNTGIPTRTDVRFRISMDSTGSEGRDRQRASYLIPNNPNNTDADYEFGANTKTDSFKSMYWDQVYTISNHISRFQAVPKKSIRSFVGIKDIDDCGSHTPFPFNKYDTDINPLFSYLCVIQGFINGLVIFINATLITVINLIAGFISFLSGTDLGVGCITIACDGTEYAPGCVNKIGREKANNPSTSANDLKNCQQTQLAETLDVFELDFYNDWINGSLYLPQFRIKTNLTDDNDFCDIDYTGNRTNYLVDTCKNPTNTRDTTEGLAEVLGNDGFIKEYDGHIYYAPNANVDKTLKLYPTEILNLGPITDSDPLNLGNLTTINELPDTTYNRPPLTDEIASDGSIETKGIDGSIMHINCGGITTTSVYCKNTTLVCELGLGPSIATIGGEANGVVNDNDMINSTVRAKLISNQLGIPYDSGYGFLVSNEYDNYRDLTSKGVAGANYIDFTQYDGNSLYFYFGINPGKSAIQKFHSKYLVHCIKVEEPTFIINLNNIINNSVIGGANGAIDIDIVGGSGDYTYTWYDESNNTISIFQDPTNLESGRYRVEVIDVNSNKVAKREFTILDPQPLSFTSIIIPEIGFGNNGEVFVNILGGIPEYTIELLGSNETPITGINYPASGSFSGLGYGIYTIRVTDGNGDSVTEIVEITAPEPLTLIIDPRHTKCGLNNGSIFIDPSGGVPPYTISVTTSNGYSNSTQYSGGLVPNTYNVDVTDSNGVTNSNNTVVIDPSNEILIDSESSTSTSISVIASGGVGVLTYKLYDNFGNELNSNISGLFISLSSGTYKVEVIDEVYCIESSVNFIL